MKRTKKRDRSSRKLYPSARERAIFIVRTAFDDVPEGAPAGKGFLDAARALIEEARAHARE